MLLKKITPILLVSCLFSCVSASAQTTPFTPPPIVHGGQVVPLYPPGSPFLNASKVGEPEQNNMAKGVPGRIQSIVNIHNPSIEFHPADPGINTGVAMIVIAGGGHNTLNVGTEGADVVHYLFNYGINSIILRNRLRRDGYNAQTDAVYDAQQAIRLVRSRAAEWGIDPKKIGVIGFSAGAELAAPAAVFFEQFEKTNSGAGDPLAGVSARPDFAILIYPGPTPFARDAATIVPKNTPPTFIATAGSGDANHAVWAMEYFSAMLAARIPNVEMHVYGNGIHANGLKHRDGSRSAHGRIVSWTGSAISGSSGSPASKRKPRKTSEAHVDRAATPARGGGRGGRGRGAGAPPRSDDSHSLVQRSACVATAIDVSTQSRRERRNSNTETRAAVDVVGRLAANSREHKNGKFKKTGLVSFLYFPFSCSRVRAYGASRRLPRSSLRSPQRNACFPRASPRLRVSVVR